MTKSHGRITVVGLSPGNHAHRTIAAQDALDAARAIILRTGIHPGIGDLLADRRVSTCDDLYEQHDSFESLYPAIVERLVGAVSAGDIVYAVPGSPSFGERTVRLLRERAEADGIPITVLPAVDAIDEIAVRLGIDPLSDELQVIDAVRLATTLDAEPFGGGRLLVDPHRPVLVAQVYSADLASATKLALSQIYDDAHTVTVITAAGVPSDEQVDVIPLRLLDRHPVNHLTSVWIDATPDLSASRVESTVAQVIARLRAPGGCPWDREQTHGSLRDAVLDEAYEVADAIDCGDLENLAEELGDLFLLVMLHSQIAAEAGHFSIEDVYDGLVRKLIRRHPHVFGDVDAPTPGDVITTWNQVKSAEKPDRPKRSRYAKLPRSMPAMAKALALLRADEPIVAVPLDAQHPGAALLAAIVHMYEQGIDPEAELDRAVAAAFGAGAHDHGKEAP